MSLPQRPGRPELSSQPSFRDSYHRRRHDIEAGGQNETPTTPSSRRNQGYFAASPHSPGPPQDQDAARDLNRKRSLIRPERTRIGRDHPNYHYRQHAQNMPTYPSTTGNDPVAEDPVEVEGGTISSGSTDIKSLKPERGSPGSDYDTRQAPTPRHAVSKEESQAKVQRKLSRKASRSRQELERRRQKELEAIRPPSLWNVYCAMVTFWCPDFILKCLGMPAKAQRRAWREKMGLISLILLICAFVGFLTFGFTQVVCGSPGVRLKINHVGSGYLIIHGKAYDLTRSTHPAAIGVPGGSNVLFDLPEKYGGRDVSFMFQNVNGACKGLITPVENSGIPTNAEKEMGWYFPCVAFSQDGSTQPNFTQPEYTGYACHTTPRARNALYELNSDGEVYFTWDEVKNKTRNLVVYSNNVLDLDLLSWFNSSQVMYPSRFDDIRNNAGLKGLDVTHLLQSRSDKQIAKCLSEIVKVGSVDTETVGCIASKTVLYISLVFILSVVLVKFLLALLFQWFIARRFAAPKTAMDPQSKERKRQIEDWSDDIYRPGPRLTDPAVPDRASKRGSRLFPTTSRFSSPYVIGAQKQRPTPTTMASQNTGSRLNAPSSMYQSGKNPSQATLSVEPFNRQSVAASRSSLMVPDPRYSTISDMEGQGPAEMIHEAVVPQPPPEWQPFGYPLAHALCLVTAYSEGEEGLRTTLDSIAMTEYPNSHKTIIVICDGMIKGKGEKMSTPEICLGMMGDYAIPPEDVQAFSYVAVASGSKRHNMAKIYSGFYDYGKASVVPREKQQRVPMMVIVKCGTPDESKNSKPGNRGKRDSQIILMSFLQKVMFDERMTELEFEMFNGLWKITGISPDFYEIVLMVDADTKVFPDSLTHMISAMVSDPEIMGLCGETKIANKAQSWVTMIQVFEYFISHHLSKSFESVFGGVTCLPGCFCMYRIKAPKGGQNYWVPILANPDVVEHYSENVVDTLHKKNLLLLGEDRYLSTLMLKTFPKRKQVFVPQAVCKTTVPDEFKVLLSQRRRWINSTVHNLMELILVRDLCGTFCFSMQFVVFMELVGTLVLPAAIAFTFYVVIISIIKKPVQIIPLILLALILGLPAILIVVTAHRLSYVAWMFIYLLSLPIWNFVLPTYAYWKFDDFSWGDTRKTAGEKTKTAGIEYEGEFDSSKITMKRWRDFEKERRIRTGTGGFSQSTTNFSHYPQHNSVYESDY
ncbi:Chitin synthase, class 3 [Ophidiomyces ophidiicola]|uniref:Chitin synthase, class 3 n=1 Tax=Ophidiomyces ophidiicola TaxID=1387563 RepID=A0ACB8UMA3_9EURO|nr:Chitin synthase, class 3 [Ophidiomyces ophidiicola]KAI1905767.1 Chitin synthase, class 3 [Ophidiomyces ophidiicola]KAI1932480.1 Chitin synthase, class 3 [Ophidiomyces ophidiicola]KAI1951053.1 Chitin synthase, class 3 [Ophidiomyces ophidiicola]KAI1960529.1 Chitin synthase, class 3 [Ophidiomyces ophidiicola]KAI1962296.1 Chitin synthase, class 3 [Ophidiomyces ophidiicola]